MRSCIACVLVGAVLIGVEAGAQQALMIRSLESPEVLQAQFNPTEIAISQPVPWKRHKSSEPDAPTLEFTAAEPRTVQFELLFDTFESGTDVHENYVGKLEALALVDPVRKRPPMVQLEWGTTLTFRGVIESIDTKYTLFLPDGTPVRATTTVMLKEAASVRVKRGTDASVITCQTPAECPPGQACFNGACAPGA
jgi:Contractile injection system tube protein